MCDRKWGPITFDRFADDKNKKIDRFNFRLLVSGTDGIDDFAFDWQHENNWCVSPIHLIPRVVNHMLICRRKGILIVPKWKSALFWPMICNFKRKMFHVFVKEAVEFNRPTKFVCTRIGPRKHICSVTFQE
jgi:hypothetical protein